MCNLTEYNFYKFRPISSYRAYLTAASTIKPGRVPYYISISLHISLYSSIIFCSSSTHQNHFISNFTMKISTILPAFLLAFSVIACPGVEHLDDDHSLVARDLYEEDASPVEE